MKDRRSNLIGSMLITGLGDLRKRNKISQDRSQTTIADENAFQSFYYRTAPAMRSYLRMLCKDTALADDLLQESYLRFLKACSRGLNDFQMKAYLYKTATSVMHDHWRAEKRQHRQMDVLPECEPTDIQNPKHAIDEIFVRLDLRQQTLLWLAYVEGFRHREIAEMLDLEEKSVRVLLPRARKQFAEMLTREGLNPKEKL